MRIVEPSTKKVTKTKEKVDRKLDYRRLLLIVPVLFAVVFVIGKQTSKTPSTGENAQQETPNVSQVEEKAEEDVGVASGDEKYQALWYSLTIQDTTTPLVAPDINNDTEFTRVVSAIAESRGYQLQKIYDGENIVRFRGVEVERSVEEALRALVLEANREGMELSISSAYRSLSEQEYIFMSRYNIQRNSGKSVEEAVNAVLDGAAPPGYSKHHSAYTVDMTCSGLGAEYFIGTVCDEWLSKDDYSVAKKFGFIPSYPKNIDVQGPVPEPWEYNYVGESTLEGLNLL